MNKLKELWGNNKVLILLGIVLIGCIIAIICVTFSFFMGTDTSVYGNRLDDIKDIEVTDIFKNEYIEKVKENEIVNDVKIDVRGKIIYVSISFKEDTTIDDAEAKAALSLDEFSEEILKHYDIMFTLKCDKSENSEGWTILGARNASGSGLNWNNNTPVESEEE